MGSPSDGLQAAHSTARFYYTIINPLDANSASDSRVALSVDLWHLTNS